MFYKLSRYFCLIFAILFLSSCVSGPSKSTQKINAITSSPIAPSSYKSNISKNVKVVKDRCQDVKPQDQHYQFCIDRKRDAQSRAKDKVVVFK